MLVAGKHIDIHIKFNKPVPSLTISITLGEVMEVNLNPKLKTPDNKILIKKFNRNTKCVKKMLCINTYNTVLIQISMASITGKKDINSKCRFNLLNLQLG